MFANADHAETPYEEFKGWWADIYKGKTFTTFLSLALRNLANSLIVAENKATVDVYGICLYLSTNFKHLKYRWIVIHIGVGYLGVARSDYDGQCESL